MFLVNTARFEFIFENVMFIWLHQYKEVQMLKTEVQMLRTDVPMVKIEVLTL